MNNRSYLIVSLALFNCFISTNYAMGQKKAVTLPSAQVLQKRLGDLGLQHFLEKSKLDTRLGGQEKYPMGVAVDVELALYDYAQYLGNPMTSRILQMRKSEIIEAILQDYPEAITDLQNKGLLD